MLGGEGASAVPERGGDGVDAAFTLNRFQEEGANGVVEFRFEIGDVVEADEVDAGDDGSEGGAVFFGGSDADGAESAAVKGIFEREEAVFLRGGVGSVVFRAATEAGELHGAIDGFRAAVGEEDAVEAGALGEFSGERALKLVVKEIGEMHGAGGFAADDFYDAWVRVAEGVDGDTAEKIEILFSGGVEDVAALAVGEEHGLALVGG